MRRHDESLPRPLPPYERGSEVKRVQRSERDRKRFGRSHQYRRSKQDEIDRFQQL